MGILIDFFTGKVIESPLTAPLPPPEPKKPYVPAKRKPVSLPVENRRAELAKIHVAKKQLAMDDETYRAMLMSQFGVESARDLSDYQRKSCILYMQRLGFEGRRGKATPQRTGEPRKRRDVPLTLEKDESGLGRDVYMRKIEAMLAEKGRAEGTAVPWGYAVAILKRQSGGDHEVLRARNGGATPLGHRRPDLRCEAQGPLLRRMGDVMDTPYYAELLDGVAVRVANMARSGLPAVSEEEARAFGRRVADMLAEDWGGSSVYIPKNLAARFHKRDAMLYREFTGSNIAELAQKYGLTQQRVYAILKAERARRGSGQLRFPGL